MKTFTNIASSFFFLLPIILPIEGNEKSGEFSRSMVVTTGLLTDYSCPKKCFNGKNCAKSYCQDCFFACPKTTCANRKVSCISLCSEISQCSTDYRCKGCLFCKEFSQSCPIVSFQDKTSSVFAASPEYWTKWLHSGKPYIHSGPPIFVDMNNDNILDYLNTMHNHPFPNQFHNRMEIGIANVTSDKTYSLLNHSERILCVDSKKCELLVFDAHASIMMDLDNDGNLDILLSNGGGGGKPNIKKYKYKKYDNGLFWGDLQKDEFTGEYFTTYSGGRDAAREAQVQMRLGRGRFLYMFDANGDGLLDIFSSQDRRTGNELVPGILLINQGNRTWKQDTGMMEYSRTMMVTDADGDGFAQEFLLNRSYCYPQRLGPETDPSFPDLGPYTNEVKKFCNRRPVGTNAVYRFNHVTNQMEEISKKYWNFWAGFKWTGSCCPNGSYENQNDCNAQSMTSGDFDDDQRADQIILYSSKLVFFFSSDRAPGELPDNTKHIGLEIALPSYCAVAHSVQLVDFDNDGSKEIMVSCKNPGMFLLYSQGHSKTDWTLQNGCNGRDALGELNNRFLALPTHEDMTEFCSSFTNNNTTKWQVADSVCKKYKSDGMVITSAYGMSIVDLNNDGFQDIVTINKFGYLRFFFNQPSPENSKNKFISFKLIGDTNASTNHYAIGATVILTSFNNKTKELVKQFHEISSVQHHTDKYGSKDDRILFGLGSDLIPKSIHVKWPSGSEQQLELANWEFSSVLKPIEIMHASSDYT